MHVLLTCRNEEDSINNEGTRVATSFLPLLVYGDFSSNQGQVNLQSLVGSGQISNSSETLRLALLPARMKRIQSKLRALEFPQDYM